MADDTDILRIRLGRQLIEPAYDGGKDPAAVVGRLTAMQAQDYLGSLWSVGLRCGLTSADVEGAIAKGRIVRTWPMRGTLHLVASEDVRWMLALLAPRATAKSAGRHAQLELAAADFEKARAILTEAMAGGRALTRAEAFAALESRGVSTAGQRGYHFLVRLAQDAVLCLGPMRGKQQTFVLLDDWVPPARERVLERPEALARLAGRYFAAHGPATIADFAWWSGLTKTDAKAGTEAVAESLHRLEAGGATYWAPAEVVAEPHAGRARVHLLPGFDEYMLGYTDRALQLGEHRDTYGSTVSSNGMFSPTVVVDGRVAGTWKRAVRRRRVEISVREFQPLGAHARTGLMAAAERYGRYLGLEAAIV